MLYKLNLFCWANTVLSQVLISEGSLTVTVSVVAEVGKPPDSASAVVKIVIIYNIP